jgi:hypothetical protein
MVSGPSLTIGGAAIAGLTAGIVLDRRLANTPSRVQGRLPDVAKPPHDGYYEQLPSAEGATANALLLWGPAVGTVLAGIGVVGAAAGLPVDRIWSRHPAGVAALALTAASAAMFIGAGTDRLVAG